MSGMAKSLRGKCVSWLTSVARAKHAARALGIEVAVTGRAGRVQGRRKACTAAGKAAPALSPSSKDVARMKENVITAENVPEQNVSGQKVLAMRERHSSLQTQCGRASQHTRSVDAAGSAFNVSSMTF